MKKKDQLIRFDANCKFIHINSKPLLAAVLDTAATTARFEKERRTEIFQNLCAAYDAQDIPIVAYKDEAVCIREPWALCEDDRVVRLTKGGGLYVCMGDAGGVVSHSYDLRRVQSASQLFLVRLVERVVEKEVVDDDAVQNRGGLRSLFLSGKAVASSPTKTSSVEWVRQDDPIRTAVVLILRPSSTPDEKERDRFIPFIFETRTIAANFFYAVSSMLTELGVPFGANEEKEVSPNQKNPEPSATTDAVETETHHPTETSASQLIDMLQAESDNETEDPDVNEFSLTQEAARHRDEILAQNIISVAQSVKIRIVSPFRLVTPGFVVQDDTIDVLPIEAPAPKPVAQDPLPYMEALNSRNAEYFSKDGMQAFMSYSNTLYRDIAKEKRMHAASRILHIKTCCNALKFLSTTCSKKVVSQWSHRRELEHYQKHQYIINLQKHLGTLRRSQEEGDPEAEAFNNWDVRENPLSALSTSEVDSMTDSTSTYSTKEDRAARDAAAAAQRQRLRSEKFEAEYVEYLRREIARLEKRIQDRHKDVETRLPAERHFEQRHSNVFPDEVFYRLQMQY